ncbi:MAG: class I SAM-dependent methyltransferase [Bradyrhizobium sp.]|nr:class I SAM-dependent methyltransferase [Bradyrhizobium sp.]
MSYKLYYELFHSESDEYASLAVAQLEHELRPLLPDDTSGKVLDVGCGFGFALMALRKIGFRDVEGVELSPEQAEVGRKRGLNVSVVSDTTKWLAQKRGCYSVVLLLDVLEHVPVSDQIDLLRAIYGSLTRGGRLIVQVPNANSIVAARWRYNDFTHHASYTEHSLYFALKSAGFDDIQIETGAGAVRPSLRLWRRSVRSTAKAAWRRYLVRWLWLQVFKAEIPTLETAGISVELNLRGSGVRSD